MRPKTMRLVLARPATAGLLLLLISGCVGQSPPAGTTGAPATAVAESSPIPSAPAYTSGTAASEPGLGTTAQASATTSTPSAATTADPVGTSAADGSFQNPVLSRDFPDPSIVNVDGTFYAYATNVPNRHIQLARSVDLVHWDYLSDALPSLPAWATLSGLNVWSPDVAKVGDKYLMYYVAEDKKAKAQCIGVATSDKPEGKFKDSRSEPLICKATIPRGEPFDPSVLVDDGKLYLYFAACCDPAQVYVQELAADGLSTVGEPVRLLEPDQSWEASFILGPTMWRQDGKYYLFYSGNHPFSQASSLGYALCDAPMGPCTDAPENPIMQSVLTKPQAIAPGSADIVLVDDATWLVYHAREITRTGSLGEGRFMWLDRLLWQDGKPVVQGPTTGPQPVP